jgi:hypothetical protein
MKTASVAELKGRLDAYLKEIEEGPLLVTRKGKAFAVLLPVTDEGEVERLVLAHSPKFQAMLEKSNRQIEVMGGIPHEQFWREVAAESRRRGGGASRSKATLGRSKRRAV